jgi:hypothetical protein
MGKGFLMTRSMVWTMAMSSMQFLPLSPTLFLISGMARAPVSEAGRESSPVREVPLVMECDS